MEICFDQESARFFFSCLHNRATVRSGAEIGLLSLRLSVSQGASLGDFLLAPACPIEKVTLWECDQPGKNPLKYSAVAGNRTRATGRTDSELFHWAIMTDYRIVRPLEPYRLVIKGLCWLTNLTHPVTQKAKLKREAVLVFVKISCKKCSDKYLNVTLTCAWRWLTYDVEFPNTHL